MCDTWTERQHCYQLRLYITPSDLLFVSPSFKYLTNFSFTLTQTTNTRYFIGKWYHVCHFFPVLIEGR